MRAKIILLLLGLMPFSLFAGERCGKYCPPDGKILLVTGQDIENIEAYLKAVKIESGGFAAYTSVEEAEGLTEQGNNGGGIQFTDKIAKDHPHSVIQLALYMLDSCEKVYSGDVNASLDKIGAWIKSANRPVYFRIGYEFDYPDNAYPPDQYVKAYRYIVDRFRKAGIANVAYVWHSYAQKVERPHEDWYPGDEYVDWFAVSYFDQKEFKELNQMAELAEKHHKPLMIAESCPWRMSTSKNSRSWEKWFVPYFQFIEKRNVKIVSYINCDWDQIPLFQSMGWKDSRVQSNPTIMKRWIEEVSQDKYLKASSNLFQLLGYEN